MLGREVELELARLLANVGPRLNNKRAPSLKVPSSVWFCPKLNEAVRGASGTTDWTSDLTWLLIQECVISAPLTEEEALKALLALGGYAGVSKRDRRLRATQALGYEDGPDAICIREQYGPPDFKGKVLNHLVPVLRGLIEERLQPHVLAEYALSWNQQAYAAGQGALMQPNRETDTAEEENYGFATDNLPKYLADFFEQSKDLEAKFKYVEALDVSRQLLAGLQHEAGLEDALAGVQVHVARQILLAAEDPKKAWRLLQAASSSGRVQENPALFVHLSFVKAEAALALGKLGAVDTALRGAARIITSSSEERTLRVLQAKLKWRKGLTQEAIEAFEEDIGELLASAESSSVSKEKRLLALVQAASSQHNLALIYLEQQDNQAAIRTLLQAVKSSRSASATLDEAHSQYMLGRAYLREGTLKSALKALTRSLKLADLSSFSEGAFAALVLRARVFHELGDSAQARQDLESAREKSTNYDQLFEVAGLLALLTAEEGDTEETEAHLNVLLLIAHESEDERKQIAAQELVARITGSLEPNLATDKEIERLEKRLSQEEVPSKRLRLYQMLGSAFLSRNEFSEAQKWFRRAEKDAKLLTNPTEIARALLGQAFICLSKFESQKASSLVDSAELAIDTVEDWEGKVSIQYARGLIHFSEGEFRDSRRILEEVHSIAITKGDQKFSKKVERDLDLADFWLELRRPEETGLGALSEDFAHLESWSESEKQPLRRLWYYEKGEELLRNVLAFSGAKSLIVASKATEVEFIHDALSPIFELSTFVSATSSDLESVPVEMFSIPADYSFRYVNFPSIREVS